MADCIELKVPGVGVVEFHAGPNANPIVLPGGHSVHGARIVVIGGATKLESLAGKIAAGLVVNQSGAAHRDPASVATYARKIAIAVMDECDRYEEEQLKAADAAQKG